MLASRLRRLLLAVAVLGCGALAAPAAGLASIPVSGGSTTLFVYPGTAKVLAQNHVGVAPVKPARVSGGGIVFPITGGSYHPTFVRGTIFHSGGLRFTVGRRSVVVRNFVVHLGCDYLTAGVGSSRVRLLNLVLDPAKLSRSGLGYEISGIRALLSGAAARALDSYFHTQLFRGGLPVGSLTIVVVPRTITLAGGQTTLALSSTAAGALKSLGITPGVIVPATSGAGGLAFPITGGSLQSRTLAGTITHSGGITLTKGATTVSLSNFTIRINSSPDLTAVVDKGARVPILNLGLSGAKVAINGQTVTVTPVTATLTGTAAKALNSAFSTTAFTAGLQLGTATVRAQVK